MSGTLPAAVLCLVAGVAIAAQVAVNSGLGRRIGVLEASAFSALLTTGLLLLAVLVTRGSLAPIAAATRQPAWLWLGGVCGVLALAAIAYAPTKLGAFAAVALLLAFQLVASLAFDATGAFGLERVPITGTRIAGFVLLLAGAGLLLRR